MTSQIERRQLREYFDISNITISRIRDGFDTVSDYYNFLKQKREQQQRQQTQKQEKPEPEGEPEREPERKPELPEKKQPEPEPEQPEYCHIKADFDEFLKIEAIDHKEKKIYMRDEYFRSLFEPIKHMFSKQLNPNEDAELNNELEKMKIKIKETTKETNYKYAFEIFKDIISGSLFVCVPDDSNTRNKDFYYFLKENETERGINRYFTSYGKTTQRFIYLRQEEKTKIIDLYHKEESKIKNNETELLKLFQSKEQEQFNRIQKNKQKNKQKKQNRKNKQNKNKAAEEKEQTIPEQTILEQTIPKQTITEKTFIKPVYDETSETSSETTSEINSETTNTDKSNASSGGTDYTDDLYTIGKPFIFFAFHLNLPYFDKKQIINYLNNLYRTNDAYAEFLYKKNYSHIKIIKNLHWGYAEQHPHFNVRFMNKNKTNVSNEYHVYVENDTINKLTKIDTFYL